MCSTREALSHREAAPLRRGWTIPDVQSASRGVPGQHRCWQPPGRPASFSWRSTDEVCAVRITLSPHYKPAPSRGKPCAMVKPSVGSTDLAADAVLPPGCSTPPPPGVQARQCKHHKISANLSGCTRTRLAPSWLSSGSTLCSSTVEHHCGSCERALILPHCNTSCSARLCGNQHVS